jgi:hypothetical protein
VKKTSRKIRGEATCSTEGWTAGMDLGDRWGHYCIENAQGEMIESGKVISQVAGRYE